MKTEKAKVLSALKKAAVIANVWTIDYCLDLVFSEFINNLSV